MRFIISNSYECKQYGTQDRLFFVCTFFFPGQGFMTFLILWRSGCIMGESGSPGNYPISWTHIQESIVSLLAIFCRRST